MYLALSVEYGQDDQLIFAQQLGVDHVVVAVDSWDGGTLERVKNRVEKSTLKLAGLEGLALDDVDAASAALRAAGAVGVGLVTARRDEGAGREPVGRGGALVGQPVLAEIDAGALAPILAAAHEAGVQLALGADVEGAGIDLDLAQLGGADPAAVIAGYGERLALVRVGNMASGRAAFLNEGEVDLPRVLLALKHTGFGGPVRAVLPPGLVGDTEWGHKGRAYDLGYLQAVLQTIASL